MPLTCSDAGKGFNVGDRWTVTATDLNICSALGVECQAVDLDHMMMTTTSCWAPQDPDQPMPNFSFHVGFSDPPPQVDAACALLWEKNSSGVWTSYVSCNGLPNQNDIPVNPHGHMTFTDAWWEASTGCVHIDNVQPDVDAMKSGNSACTFPLADCHVGKPGPATVVLCPPSGP